jgi:hypothetical protein
VYRGRPGRVVDHRSGATTARTAPFLDARSRVHPGVPARVPAPPDGRAARPGAARRPLRHHGRPAGRPVPRTHRRRKAPVVPPSEPPLRCPPDPGPTLQPRVVGGRRGPPPPPAAPRRRARAEGGPDTAAPVSGRGGGDPRVLPRAPRRGEPDRGAVHGSDVPRDARPGAGGRRCRARRGSRPPPTPHRTLPTDDRRPAAPGVVPTSAPDGERAVAGSGRALQSLPSTRNRFVLRSGMQLFHRDVARSTVHDGAPGRKLIHYT